MEGSGIGERRKKKQAARRDSGEERRVPGRELKERAG